MRHGDRGVHAHARTTRAPAGALPSRGGRGRARTGGLRSPEHQDRTLDRSSPGCVDVETRLPILYAEGVGRQRLSVQRMAEVTATNPARIFGLYPKKGIIATGSDADLVLIDPEAHLRVSPETLHMQVHYSPYAGWELVGLPTTTISKGRVIVDNGQFLGHPGDGAFVERTIAPEVLAQPC